MKKSTATLLLSVVALATAEAADVQLPPRATPAVKTAVKPAAELFDLGDVRLLPSDFLQAMETDKAYLLWTDPDRFLAFFQKTAGIFKGSDVLLGWPGKGIGAEVSQWSLGHYISACSQMYRATGDERLLDRVNHIIDELAKCQAVEGNAGLFVSAKARALR